jgi:hypothetical protein
MTHHQTTEMKNCIQACLSCHVVCEETVHHCLTKGGEHAEPHHIALLQTCAQICTTSADAMLRGTHEHAHICRACAEICEACAAACEAMGDDEAMQRCATACRACAESCRQMAA